MDRTTAPERERVARDDAVKGLGLRDCGGAERRWIVQTRAGGVTLKRTPGPERALSRKGARAAARALLANLRGETPPAVAAPPAFDPATTIAAFAPRFLADCAGLWKASVGEQHGESLRLGATGRSRLSASCVKPSVAQDRLRGSAASHPSSAPK